MSSENFETLQQHQQEQQNVDDETPVEENQTLRSTTEQIDNVNGGDDNIEVNLEKHYLQRTIGLVGGSGIILGTIIGSGIFISPTLLLDLSGSIGLFLIVWLVSGVIAILGGLCFAELGTAIPKSGAEYNYILDAFGPFLAFLFMWTSVFIIKPASVTIIALTFAIYASEPFFPGCDVPEVIIKSLGAICIILVTLLNTFSVKWSIRINNILNWFKIACIVIIVGIGTVQLFRGGTKNFYDIFDGTSTNPGTIGSAFFQGLWAYDGWNNLNYAAEEMKNPNKTLPRSITLGMILVTIFYTLINIAYVSALGKSAILQSSAVALTVGQQYLGIMAWIIPILVACSTFGATNSTIFSNGREGHLPKIMSAIHRDFHTPVPSLFFTALISMLMLIPPSDEIGKLIDFFNFASWVFFGICFAAQIHIRLKRPDITKPFKIWIGIPFIMIVVSLFLVILPIFKDYKGSLIATGIIASGIPVYLLFFKFSKIIPQCFFTGNGNSALIIVIIDGRTNYFRVDESL